MLNRARFRVRTPEEREQAAQAIERLAERVRRDEVVDFGLTAEKDDVVDPFTGKVMGYKPRLTQITVWWG